MEWRARRWLTTAILREVGRAALVTARAGESRWRMAIYVSYSCPHCGSAAVIPLTRVERAEVAPCPACGVPARRTRGALAINWAVCCMFYAAIVFVPSAVLAVFLAAGTSSVLLSLVTGFSLGAMAAAVLGVPAYIYGYFFAEFEGRDSSGPRRGEGNYERGARAVCSICGASLRGGESRAGLCSSCQQKAMG